MNELQIIWIWEKYGAWQHHKTYFARRKRSIDRRTETRHLIQQLFSAKLYSQKKRQQKDQQQLLEETQKKEREIKRQEQIRRNLMIIKQTEGSRFPSLDSIRRDAAFYRLYKELNLSPTKIAKLTRKSPTQVGYNVGRMFASLCLVDGKCVFRKYLAPFKHRSPARPNTTLSLYSIIPKTTEA